MKLENWISARIRKKCSKAIVEEKTLQRVNLCIEPGGRHTFLPMEAPGSLEPLETAGKASDLVAEQSPGRVVYSSERAAHRSATSATHGLQPCLGW